VPGLFAVNGPPGVGKTTMLRDVVAAILVRRAIKLAGLRSPEHAFAGEPVTWETPSWDHRISPLRPELAGDEIVVASSNNAAVENVTSEIPARAASPANGTRPPRKSTTSPRPPGKSPARARGH
jgi:hypothetical protein